MKSTLLRLGLIALLSQGAYAASSDTPQTPLIAPQPTPCINGVITTTGDQWWTNFSLKLTNNCGKPIDFQNASGTFENGVAVNTNVWGSFEPLTYPDNDVRLTATNLGNGKFLETFNLHFPSYEGANSVLPAGRSITLHWGDSKKSTQGPVSIYTGTPVSTGTISLNNTSAKPANVAQTYALVHVTMNGQTVSNVQLPWNGSQNIPNLAPGTYAIAADSVSDSSGVIYQGTTTPATVNLAADQIATVSVSYAATPQTGKVSIQLQALPSQLAGYTGKPTAVLTRSGTGSSVSQILNWNSATLVSQLVNGASYSLSTPAISYNGYQCTPTFNPTSVVANATTAPVVNLTYACTQTALNNVSLNVSGAPTTLSSFKVTLTPNTGTTPVTQTVSLSNGAGTSVVQLPNSVIYNVSSDTVSGYSITYNPQPLTSTPNAVENITLSQSTGTPVDVNGQLKVCGNQLCNKNGQAIQLRGMSTHGLQWYGSGVCITQKSLDTMVNSFKSNVIRLSLYVQEGGYDTNPTGYTNQVNQLINEATKRGIYAIVDWHILTPGDPNVNLAKAKTFFTAVANANKGKVNVIYEICNEPNGVSWSVVKSYAEQIIPVIRAIDPNAVILVGTRGWSSLGVSDGSTSQEIINNKVNATNIMYTFHFYAASHLDNYLNELDKASNSLPIFVTEFGTQTYSGGGANNFTQSDKYMALMKQKKIGWTNWNFSDDSLSGAIWQPGTCDADQWQDSRLKPSGTYIKAKIISG